ncbi:MAG: DUF2156 domain-containing protein [Candidatus Omnitrophica bacterium]|nr:DUF2156 domain-containing protein [Candidatus Omnitrophota bacterium]
MIGLLKQKEVVEEYLRESQQGHSAYSFTNLFAWQEHFDFQLEIVDGNLCIFADNGLGPFLYLPPLGKQITQHTIEKCFERMEAKNKGNGISRIENVVEGQLDLFPEEKFARYHKGDEYGYYRKDIVDLKGNAYKSKRSDYNFFSRNFSCEYSAYTDDMLEECQRLYVDWAKQRQESCRDDIYQHMLKENEGVHSLMMKHWKALGLVGRVVSVDGQIVAYSFGCALTKDIFCVLIEVARLDMKGLPVFIFREVCRDKDAQSFQWINVMDDFGLENLRQVKMSFRPKILFPSYVITLKQNEIR